MSKVNKNNNNKNNNNKNKNIINNSLINKTVRNIIMLSFIMLAALSLTGCKNKEDNIPIMRGLIVEKTDYNIIVKPEEGSIELNSSDVVSIGTRKIKKMPNVKVDDVIEVCYSGEILEVYPAELKGVTSIKVINNVKNKNEYKDMHKDISTLKNKDINKDELVMFRNTLYTRSNEIIDYAPIDNEPIGIIDTLIDSNLIPMENGETNNDTLIDSLVAEANDNSMVLLINNIYTLFDAVK